MRLGKVVVGALMLSLGSVSVPRLYSQAVNFDDPDVRYSSPTQEDVQEANEIENLVDEIPNDVVRGAERGFLAGAATLIGLEIATGGAITVPLAVSVLSSGAFLGAASSEWNAIDTLKTALDSITGGDDE